MYKECMWCTKKVLKEHVIVSAYGYPTCSSECAEEIDKEEHTYRVAHDPENAIRKEDREL